MIQTRLELRDRAERDDLPTVDDGHPPAQFFGLTHQVRRVHHRAALFVEIVNDGPQFARIGQIERVGRLVQDQNRGIVDHRFAKGQLHFLAGRVCLHGPVDNLAEIQQLDDVRGLPGSGIGRNLVESTEKVEVLASGQFPIQPAFAHQHAADARADVVLGAPQIIAVDRRRPRRQQEERRQAFDERRLAGAVRSQQAERFTRENIQVDALERFDCPGLVSEKAYAVPGLVRLA